MRRSGGLEYASALLKDAMEPTDADTAIEKWSKSSGTSSLELFLAGFSVGIDAHCFGAGAAVRAVEEMRPTLERLAALRSEAQP